jgi:hypothetical protein
MAVRAVVHHVISIGELFEMTQNTTYQEYVYAVRSNLVTERWRLQPPNFTRVKVNFRFHRLPHLLHDHCPGRGATTGAFAYSLDSLDEAIAELVQGKETFWCSFCEKPVFFPPVVHNSLGVACNPPSIQTVTLLFLQSPDMSGFSRMDRKVPTSILARLASRSVTGHDPPIQVHQHGNFDLLLVWEISGHGEIFVRRRFVYAADLDALCSYLTRGGFFRIVFLCR